MHLPTVLELFTGVRLNNFRLFNHYAYFHLWSNLYSQMMVIFPLGFNRSMQHTRNCFSRRSVADEAKT
jgi:hypothetical protein